MAVTGPSSIGPRASRNSNTGQNEGSTTMRIDSSKSTALTATALLLALAAGCGDATEVGATRAELGQGWGGAGRACRPTAIQALWAAQRCNWSGCERAAPICEDVAEVFGELFDTPECAETRLYDALAAGPRTGKLRPVGRAVCNAISRCGACPDVPTGLCPGFCFEFEPERVIAMNGDAEIVADLLEPADPIGTVVLIPSAARGGDDFTDAYGSDLAVRIAERGYQVITVWPRGFLSVPDQSPPSIQLLASDVAAVLDEYGEKIPAGIVGHAFGQRVGRMLATDRPDLVERLVLVAAGGQAPVPPEILQDLFFLGLNQGTEEERIAALDRIFFAPGNDSAIWVDGWSPATAFIQNDANNATPGEEYTAGGGVVDMCVLQAEFDVIAPAEISSDVLKEQFPDRVELIEITNAGHAMLPEQPEQVSDAVLHCLAPDDGGWRGW